MKKTGIALCLAAALTLAGCGGNPNNSGSNQEGPVELYQLAPSREPLMQSYVIKTKHNKLIVIDGGIDGMGKEADPYMPAALRSILGLEEGAYFEIDAWFLSHPHSDHYYELSKCMRDYTKDSNYKIKEFYFDFPDIDDYYAARSELGIPAYTQYTISSLLTEFKENLNNYAEVNGIEIESASGLWYDDLNGYIINKEEIHWGLDIEIDGVRFEIMQTWDYADRKGSEDLNETSLVMRAWVEDQSILFLNDLGGYNSDRSSGARLINTYGEDLKSDIVQMAHHGQRGSQKALYDLVNADVFLWATPWFVWGGSDKASHTNLVQARKWVNGGVDFTTASAHHIVACLYEAYPKAPTSVADWNAVKDGMKITLPYKPEA